MYLVELDSFTGQVKIHKEYDGVRAVKEFREVLDHPDLGLECFTAIALTVDYLTPIKYYRQEDRPYKAMEMATGGNRRAFVWDQELIQKALIKYDELQYNPTVEEKRTLDFMLLEKLKEINNQKEETISAYGVEEATEDNISHYIEDRESVKNLLKSADFESFDDKERKSFIRKVNTQIIIPENRKLKEKKSLKDEERMMVLFKQLHTIKNLIENFNKNAESLDIFKDGPVRNGYKLTRLEEKALDKNSFYHKAR